MSLSKRYYIELCLSLPLIAGTSGLTSGSRTTSSSDGGGSDDMMGVDRGHDRGESSGVVSTSYCGLVRSLGRRKGIRGRGCGRLGSG